MTTPPTSRHAIKPDPARIIVPRRHGEILIEPPLAKLAPALTHRAAENSTNTLLGVPFADIKHQARTDLVTAIKTHAVITDAPAPGDTALDQPWIITGHQVEFFHAGVWAKVLAADALARRTHALAIDLLVDHDTIPHLGIELPTVTRASSRPLSESSTPTNPDHWSRTLVTWPSEKSHASIAVDSLSPPTPEQFEQWDAALAAHPVSHVDSLAFILSYLRDTSLNYSAWMSRARARLEAALDIHVHHVTTGHLCDTRTWHLFVAAWIANADSWCPLYNQKLADYRRSHNIHNDHHPMPDLQIASGEFELPFWVYRPGEPRQRLSIRRLSDTIELNLGDVIRTIPLIPPNPSAADGWAAANALEDAVTSRGHLLRPRALTITMYTRLFLADLFIHGIGGALYDQITDEILSSLFDETPPYACVSAAWLLPLTKTTTIDEPISSLAHRRHHLMHNPQLGIDPFTAIKTDFAELIALRRTLIESLRTAPRETRRDLFRQLHATNALLHAKSPRALQKLDAEISTARETAEQNKVTLYREYYLALHTMDSLRTLIHAIRE